MKIEKFIKIKNVGKYKGYTFKWWNEYIFWNNNIIFWENAYWKSTLTAIFKSLQTWNKDYIIWRKTFLVSDEQEVEVLFGTQKISFSNNFKIDSIEIFDNDFISKNVFYGDEISKEQQWNLYEILLSENIQKQYDEIKRLENDKKQKEKEKDNYRKENYKGNLDFEDFKKLKQINNIDQKIKEKEQEIRQEQNKAKLKTLLEKNIFWYSFDNLKSVMKETIKSNIEENLKKHLDKFWLNNNNWKNFLNHWIWFQKNHSDCIFCWQVLNKDSQELIESYKKLFDNSYEKIKKNIQEKWEKFVNLNFKEVILELEKEWIDFWTIDTTTFYYKKIKIDEIIDEKQKNLDKSIVLDNNPDFIEFEKIYNEIKNFLNKKTSEIQGNKDLSTLQKELENLKINKFRYDSEWLELCRNFEKLEKDINDVRNNINKKEEELKNNIQEIFKKYSEDINDFLWKMNASFKIHEFKPEVNKRLWKSHFCNYWFVFDGYDNCTVKITNKQNQSESEKEDLPYFKNTLSDSEKRTLAFAFFLTKLKNDNHLSQKIVVLDDPFSSFDSNRREKTIQLFRDLKDNNKESIWQSFILTHEKSFYIKLFKEFWKDNVKTFRITNSFDEWSKIDLYNEEDFLLESYFRDLRFIENAYKNSTNLDEALKKCRICLEHILKRKYYIILKDEKLKDGKAILQFWSISSYLDKIWDKCQCKQEILNLNLHQEMHDGNSMLAMNDSEKNGKLKEFLELVEKI